MINRVVNGKRYWLVPSIKHRTGSGTCDHCVFHNPETADCELVDKDSSGRYADSQLIGCNPVKGFDDYIFIPRTKAAMAAYVAHKLEGT
jgi:hypothetical protein